MYDSPMTVKFRYLLTLLLSCCSLTRSNCLEFNFPSFENYNARNLTMSGSYVVLGTIQVTVDVRGLPIANLSGRTLFKDRFKLWSENRRASFVTNFVIVILNQTNPGGEGMAFILTDDAEVPDNSYGKWLGIVNEKTNMKKRIVAIEFDTRQSWSEDLDSNHVGLDVYGINNTKQVSLSNHGVNLSAGKDVYVRIEYDGKYLKVYVSMDSNDMKDPVLYELLDLSTVLSEEVYVGFSASTSEYTEVNCLKSWMFSGSDIDDEDEDGDGDEDSKKLSVLIVVPVLVVLLLCLIGFYWYYRRWRINREKEEEANPSIEAQIKENTTAPRKFGLRELKKATGDFSSKNKLGEGGFGAVYKGSWRNKEIAVKRISKKSRQGKQGFVAEITTIGNLNHKNLVNLIGWCYERNELLLVYEFMPNRSLDKFIFYEKGGKINEEFQQCLRWNTRLNVIHGTAKALEYLHNGCEKRVLHRDIKASNIMLDSDFQPKLGDFGLARTIQKTEMTHHSTNEIAGTPGYMAPETFLTGRATVETDVYAFGILILEASCGRKPGFKSEQNYYHSSIVYWLWELHRNGKILDAVDSRLNGEFDEVEMERVLILGLGCCHPNPHKRPTMKTVLQVLTGEADPPDVPGEIPAFVWPAMQSPFKNLHFSLMDSNGSAFTDLTGR